MDSTIAAVVSVQKPTNLPPNLNPATPKEFGLLPLKWLQASKTNPRKQFDGPDFDELVASIDRQGVLVPLLVRPHDFVKDVPSSLNPTPAQVEAKFEVIAGERRYRAAKKLGLEQVPVRIMDLNDEETLEVQIVENLQRKDVQPIEEAAGYSALLDSMQKATPGARRPELVEQLAKRVGKSVRYIYARAKLTELIPELQKDILDGVLQASHGDELVRLCPKDQADFRESHLYDRVYDQGKERLLPRSVRFVKEEIARGYQLELAKAKFPIDDPKLVSAAGACGSCLKNSANNPLVEGAKKAVCMDRDCFAKKGVAFIAIEALKDKAKAAKPELLRVTPSHYLPNGRRNEADKPKLRKEWKTAHAGECENVQPAVVVDVNGLHDQALNAKMVCANTKCKVHFGLKPVTSSSSTSVTRSANSAASAEQQKRADEEEAQRKIELAGGIALFEAVLGKVKGVTQVEFELILKELTSAHDCSDEAEATFARAMNLDRPQKDAPYDWIRSVPAKASAKMSLEQKAKLLVGILISPGIDEDSYGNFQREDLEKLAKKYGLDAKAIVAKGIADATPKPQTSAKEQPTKGTGAGSGMTTGKQAGPKVPPASPTSPKAPAVKAPKKASPKKSAKASSKKGGRK